MKLKGTTDERVTLENINVTLFAHPGAKLTSKVTMTTGNLLEIKGVSDVAIYDLEISGASGSPNGLGIVIPTGATGTVTLTRVVVSDNLAGGISAGGGTLTLTQSRIFANPGGGISITGAQFDLTNNFIALNGGPTTGYGGITFNQTNNGMRRFEFNTVTENSGGPSLAIGVTCNGIATPITFSNNIIYNNQIGSGRTQVGGPNCSWTYSDIGPDTVTAIGNISSDPMFNDPVQRDFRLKPTSPARDAADPASSLAIDIDGEARPEGPRRDMGADEVR